LEEFAAFYYVFLDSGASVMLASPRGGQPPLDPSSDEPTAQTKTTRRFKQDKVAQHALPNTIRLSSLETSQFDAVFYPGGHGPLWDLTNDNNPVALIQSMIAAGKPVALVCHAPGVLKGVKLHDGSPLVKDRHVAGFSDTEEEAAQLTKVVPFLVEDELRRLGGL
jgi:putative intracellular protease/amidase